MLIRQRSYRLLTDFLSVHTFLTKNYDFETLNSYLLPQFFEYAHTHPMFQAQMTHRFGIWEDDNGIVGVVCYEMGVGEGFLVTDRRHASLLPEMLRHAEKELSINKDNSRCLSIWITDKEKEKMDILDKKGYKKVYTEPVCIFPYNKPFPIISLPQGYTIISLAQENDLRKINDCLWKGFDHGDQPDDDLDGRALMQSGPNFSKELTTVIKAPNGDYACFAGMWFDQTNNYAYLEPLATVPEHRRMGLATIALTEGMKKTQKLGANYCFGGVVPFYTSIGFEIICNRELWKKEWEVSI